MPILTPEERVGTELAERYRIEKILGKGGMGVVYRGRHLWTEREVAVKILFHQYASDEGIARRFLQEARTAAQIKHPNVVDVLDMGQDANSTVYLVLEMLEGMSLAEYLETHTPLDPEDTLAILLPVMDALAAAHNSGIVHRDLKPDNIFLSVSSKGKRVPKLLDFGIAKVVRNDGTPPTTQTGAVIGTPQYMAPEQVRGSSDVGASSDVWSMGVVLFEALTGRLPFEDELPTAILAAILTRKPPSIAEMGVELPSPIAMTIDRALVEDRSIRFKTMRAFATALVEAADECGLSLDRVTMLPRISDDLVPSGTSERTTLASGKRPTPGPATRAMRTPRPSDPQDPLEFPETTEPWSERPAPQTLSKAPPGRLAVAVLGVGVLLAAIGGGALMLGGDPPVAADEGDPPNVASAAPTVDLQTMDPVVVQVVETETDPETDLDPETDPDLEGVADAPVETEMAPVETEAQRELRRLRRERRRLRAEAAAAAAAAMNMETMSMETMTMRGANDSLIIH